MMPKSLWQHSIPIFHPVEQTETDGFHNNADTRTPSPARGARLVGPLSVHQKVAGLIPGRGAQGRKPLNVSLNIDVSFSFPFFLYLSLFPHPRVPLSLKSRNIYLGFKNLHTQTQTLLSSKNNTLLYEEILEVFPLRWEYPMSSITYLRFKPMQLTKKS